MNFSIHAKKERNNLLTKLEALKFQFETLKQNLKNEGISFRNSKEYKILHRSISRCQKKIEDQETTPSKNSQKTLKNSSPFNVVELSEKIQLHSPEKINSPVVEKTLTLYEKELLTHAKIDVAWCRAYVQKRKFTDSKHLAIYRAVRQPPTTYDKDLLAFIKLYPVVLADPLYEGEEPGQMLIFGFKEAKLRELDKLKLLFSNRPPKSHEADSIILECEIERVESELVFLKGLLENNPAMKKNASIAERIAFCTIYIDREKKALFFPGVPKFKGCGF